jgi:hypothetical protein
METEIGLSIVVHIEWDGLTAVDQRVAGVDTMFASAE